MNTYKVVIKYPHGRYASKIKSENFKNAYLEALKDFESDYPNIPYEFWSIERLEDE